jgi:hypothetical protein
MTEQQLNDLCNWHAKGAKIKVAQHYSGRRRVKISHGPFGFFTKRISCLDTDLQRFNAQILKKPTLN